MITPRTNRKLIEFTGWLMAGFLLLVIVTGCSPYLPVDPTATPSPTQAAEMATIATTQTPYWQLAVQTVERLLTNPVVDYSGRATY